MDESLGRTLLGVLRNAAGAPDLEYAEPPVPLTGGFWAELLTFRLAGASPPWDRPLVARLMPDPVLASKETIIQRAVADAGFPTPVVRAAGGRDDGLGRAFMVMDRADGAPLLGGLSTRAIVHLPRLARRIPEVLAAAMAHLHRLDPGPVHVQLNGTAASISIDQMLDGLEAGATGYDRTDLVDAIRWLRDNRPAGGPDVICHGDLHPFNVLADADGGVTVLDWSASLLSPRAYDVGFTSLLLGEPPIVAPRPLQPIVRAAGRWLSRRFLHRYQEQSAVNIDEASLQWHQVLVCLRALVEVAGWVQADELEGRSGHPWLVCGPAFASRATALTGAKVTPR
jgi:aminoglycoside phosphotransferase (APT) family kinase protein